jgi:hypothetical protein
VQRPPVEQLVEEVAMLSGDDGEIGGFLHET